MLFKTASVNHMLNVNRRMAPGYQQEPVVAHSFYYALWGATRQWDGQLLDNLFD